MNNDSKLIFEAYKNFRTFVKEQSKQELEKKAKKVESGAVELRKEVEAMGGGENSGTPPSAPNQTTAPSTETPATPSNTGQVSIGGIPVGSQQSSQQPAASTPAGATGTPNLGETPRKFARGAPQRFTVQNQTNTSDYVPQAGTNTASSVTPRPETPSTPAAAETPSPVTPQPPSNIYSGKGGQAGNSSAQVQPSTIPATQYSGKGQASQTQNPQDIINMERERAAAASVQPQQTPTISAPANTDIRSQKFIMTSKGPRPNPQYNPYRDPNNPNYKVA